MPPPPSASAGVVIARHWLLGVGPADTQEAMREQYQWRDFGLRLANRVEVHNQYVLALLGGGVVGLGLLLGLLLSLQLWSLTQANLRGNTFVCAFLFGQGAAMMIDSVTALHIGQHLLIFGYGFLVVAAEAAHQEQKQRARNVPRAALPATEDSSEPAASQ